MEVSASNGVDGSQREEIVEAESAVRSHAPSLDESHAECFVWEDYFEQSGAMPADASLFTHVEASLDCGICVDDYLELQSNAGADVALEAATSTAHLAEVSFWPAKTVHVCGKAIKLRFLGCKNADNDVWYTLGSSECQRKIRSFRKLTRNLDSSLKPPQALLGQVSEERLNDLLEQLSEKKSVHCAPADFVDNNESFAPVDLIREGQCVEVQLQDNPLKVWPATVGKIVGGRVLLSYFDESSPTKSFWLFVTSERLHCLGWVDSEESHELGCYYSPPGEMQATNCNWLDIAKQFVQSNVDNSISAKALRYQMKISTHSFKKGMKLEVVDQKTFAKFLPATVVEVLNDYFFVVELDDASSGGDTLDRSHRLICHGQSFGILPANFCRNNNVRLMPPKGFKETEFQWPVYVRQLNSAETDALFSLAPTSCFDIPKSGAKLRKGHKLEAANPFNPEDISAATITKSIGHLLLVHLDAFPNMSSFIVDSRSLDLFPCGWCLANNYTLKGPVYSTLSNSADLADLPEYSSSIPPNPEQILAPYMPDALMPKKSTPWCPTVFINWRCFVGAYLCKTRIAELPRQFGPGPLEMVLTRVLSGIVSCAYRPREVLSELQADATNPNPNRDQVSIKAKYRNKRWRGSVEICQKTEHVVDYCRQICILLECCPNLFGLVPVSDRGKCPLDCHKMLKSKLLMPHKHNAATRTVRKHTRADADILSEARKQLANSNIGIYASPSITTRRTRRRPSILMPMGAMDKPGSVVSRELVKRKQFDVTAHSCLGIKRRDDVKRRFGHHLGDVSRTKTVMGSVKHGVGADCLNDAESEQAVIDRKAQVDIIVPDLTSNPLIWTCDDLIAYIKQTDLANLAPVLRQELIDGQAFMLLTIHTAQEYLHLKLGPAVKLCCVVDKFKSKFFQQYPLAKIEEQSYVM